MKGGVLRTAHLTPEPEGSPANLASDTSDLALAGLLMRLRVATDLTEIRILSEQIERLIFHKHSRMPKYSSSILR
jgi:hypothetical protein